MRVEGRDWRLQEVCGAPLQVAPGFDHSSLPSQLLAAGELLPLLPVTLPTTVTATLGTSAPPSAADALRVDCESSWPRALLAYTFKCATATRTAFSTLAGAGNALLQVDAWPMKQE